MERGRGPDGADQPEYLLTEQGRELVAVVVALTEWGDRWHAPDGPPVLFTHAACGGPVRQRFVCEHCDEVPDAAHVRAVAGPGMPAGIAARMPAPD